MFYKSLHTIAGTHEKTFAGQDESDAIIEDLEVALGSLREELHVFRQEKRHDGRQLDASRTTATPSIARRMGTGGYAVPSIVEPDI